MEKKIIPIQRLLGERKQKEDGVCVCVCCHRSPLGMTWLPAVNGNHPSFLTYSLPLLYSFFGVFLSFFPVLHIMYLLWINTSVPRNFSPHRRLLQAKSPKYTQPVGKMWSTSFVCEIFSVTLRVVRDLHKNTQGLSQRSNHWLVIHETVAVITWPPRPSVVRLLVSPPRVLL